MWMEVIPLQSPSVSWIPLGRKSPFGTALSLTPLFFLLDLDLPTYSINPVLILSSAPFSARHPVTPSPRPPPLPLPLVRFPDLGVSHGLSPSLIFNTSLMPAAVSTQRQQTLCRGMALSRNLATLFCCPGSAFMAVFYDSK